MNILYVTNYYLEDVIEQRHSEAYISQAGQNKGKYIIDMLEHGGNHVTVWSNAWTNSRSFRFYKGFRSKINENVYYSDIVGIPGANALMCLSSSKRFLKRYVKEHKIDVIVFYNMRLENSKLALYAKKHFGIPIVLQYEDGLTTDAHITGMKRRIYQNMENKVLTELDGAFLVNSKIQVPCPSVVIRGAIREQKNIKGVSDSPKQSAAGESTVEEAADGERQQGAEVSVPKILFASTLDRQRGIEVVMEALKYTDAKFKLQITGRGDKEELAKNSTDDRVEFLGYLDYETYQQKLQEAEICLNAQLAHHEFGNFSFPSKIFEYLSAGKLVISSDVADAEEALGEALLIYHEDNPKELAKAMERGIAIWQNKMEWQHYQRKIQEVIQDNSMGQVAAKVNELLEKVVK